MTEENNQPNQEGTPTPVKADPPPAPAIDVGELAKQVAEQAKSELDKHGGELTAKAAKEIAARLDPDRSKTKELDPILKEFIANPEAFVATLSQVTADKTKEDIRKAQAQEREDTKTLSALSEEYPEVVKENLDIVDAMFSQVSGEAKFKGSSRNEIIEEAVKRTASRLRLKPMSERSSEDSFRNSVFPGVGASSSGSGGSSNGTDSAFDYIKGRREAMQKAKRG